MYGMDLQTVHDDQKDDFHTSTPWLTRFDYILVMKSQLIVQHMMWLGNWDMDMWKLSH